MEDDQIIKEDKLSNPNCFYSTSSQQVCSTKNDSFVCETLKSIMRNCPTKSPVEIFRKSETKTGEDSNKHIQHIFKGSDHGEIPKLLDPFADIMNSFFGISRSNKFKKEIMDVFDANDDDAKDSLPGIPHRIFRDGSGDNSESNFKQRGRMQGPIEKI